jgi:predicted Zn-dependent protease
VYCARCGTRFAAEASYCAACGAARPCGPDGDALARARALAAGGQLARATELLRAALAARPDDRALRVGLAAALLQAGDCRGGLTLLDQLRATGTFDPVVEAYAGGALLGLGRVAEAKDVLDRARDRAPDDPSVALKRGELFCRLGIYPTALAELERGLALGRSDDESRRAFRSLIRFAREKSRRGFVRRLVAGARAAGVGAV